MEWGGTSGGKQGELSSLLRKLPFTDTPLLVKHQLELGWQRSLGTDGLHLFSLGMASSA